jgi:multiple sugar transport system permease protein
MAAQLTHATQTTEMETPRRHSVNWREAAWGYFFIAPGILGVIIFTFFPVFFALGISFTDWSILAQPNWVGADNYTRLVVDPIFAKVMRNTLYYTIVSVPLGLVASLFFAIILNQKIRFLALFRTAYFLPVISASVAVSMVWMWLLDSNFGLINLGLVRIGLSPVQWLSNPLTAMPAIIIVSVWRSMGWNMIIFLAALQDVPEDLYAAGKIDGANNWQLFRSITLPLITPAIFFTTITGFIGSFQGFDLVYNMTQGGPARSTSVVGYYIWETAFKYSKMGYGAAMAYVLFGIILVITLVQWRVRRRWVFGED